VGGAAAASALAAAHAAGFRAVLLAPPHEAADAASSLAALPRAARASDVPRALASASDVVAGIFLTRGRERGLLRDGLLHPLPRRGLVALGIDASAPLAPQGPWHVLLHKATDQLAACARPGALAFTPEVEALRAYVAAHPRTALLAPLAALEVVFDRAAAAALLAALPVALRSGGGGAHARLAAPASVPLDSWEPTALAASLAGATLLDACACGLKTTSAWLTHPRAQLPASSCHASSSRAPRAARPARMPWRCCCRRAAAPPPAWRCLRWRKPSSRTLAHSTKSTSSETPSSPRAAAACRRRQLAPMQPLPRRCRSMRWQRCRAHGHRLNLHPSLHRRRTRARRCAWPRRPPLLPGCAAPPG
jgi:hypothetical protein